MGFLRERKIKSNGQTYTYWYWCKRIRSRKKSGGNGKVKSVELCLGRYLYSKRFAYHCYTGDIDIKAFLNEYVRHEIQTVGIRDCSDDRQEQVRNGMSFRLSFPRNSSPQLALRAPRGIDLRCKDNRQWVERVRRDIKILWNESQFIDEMISTLAYWRWLHDQLEKQRNEGQAQLVNYRKDPQRTWTEIKDQRDPRTGKYTAVEVEYYWPENAEQILEDQISECDRDIQRVFDLYEEKLKTIGHYAPKRDRTSFRQRLVRDAESRKEDKKLVRQWELEVQTAAS